MHLAYMVCSLTLITCVLTKRGSILARLFIHLPPGRGTSNIDSIPNLQGQTNIRYVSSILEV